MVSNIKNHALTILCIHICSYCCRYVREGCCREKTSADWENVRWADVKHSSGPAGPLRAPRTPTRIQTLQEASRLTPPLRSWSHYDILFPSLESGVPWNSLCKPLLRRRHTTGDSGRSRYPFHRRVKCLLCFTSQNPTHALQSLGGPWGLSMGSVP